MIKRDYYDNGQLYYEIPYNEGQIHGIRRSWYSNGQLIYEHPYHEGQIHGIMKSWHKSGELWYKDYCLYGRRVTEEEYQKHELIKKLSGL